MQCPPSLLLEAKFKFMFYIAKTLRKVESLLASLSAYCDDAAFSVPSSSLQEKANIEGRIFESLES